MDVYYTVNRSFIKDNPIPRYTHSWGVFKKNKFKNDKKIFDILESLRESEWRVPESLEHSVKGLIQFYDQVKKFETCIKSLQSMESPKLVREIHSLLPKKPLQLALCYPHLSQNRSLIFLKFCSSLQRLGISVPLSVSSVINIYDNSHYLLCLTDGGLSLPHKSLYADPNISELTMRPRYPKSQRDKLPTTKIPLLNNLIHKYLAEFVGEHEAHQAAINILYFEEKLSTCNLSPAEKNDPQKAFNLFSLLQLKSLYPHVPWDIISQKLLCGEQSKIVLESPTYVSKLFHLIESTDMACIGHYFLWRVIFTYLPYFKDQDYIALYHNYLQGLDDVPPLELTHVDICTEYYGGLLCYFYQRRHAIQASERIERLQVLVSGIKESLKQRVLHHIDWMAPETKTVFLEKLSCMTVKIGGQDWAALPAEMIYDRIPPITLCNNDFLASVLALDTWNHDSLKRQHRMPVDRRDWFMYSFSVNAYYSAELNEIVFPWGIIQPPFFSLQYSFVKNVARLGSIIGHEIIHGFDNHGCNFDKIGNLKKWWLPADEMNFHKKIQSVIDVFSSIRFQGIPLDGQLTCPENVADISGLRLSYDCLLRSNPSASEKKRFFVYYARTLCSYHSHKYLKLMTMLDSHSPAPLRVNIPLLFFDEFYSAFGYSKRDLVTDRSLNIY